MHMSSLGHIERAGFIVMFNFVGDPNALLSLCHHRGSTHLYPHDGAPLPGQQAHGSPGEEEEGEGQGAGQVQGPACHPH